MKTKQYKIAKQLMDKGFGVIAIIPVFTDKDGKKSGGKTPSIRSNQFSDIDDQGNPKPKLDEFDFPIKNKYGKTEYAKDFGGSKNPILKGQEDRLYKTFCNPDYTDRGYKLLNVGIITGQTGVVAIDIDGADGAANLRVLEAKYGELPPTLTVSTGRDEGHHRYYRTPKINGKYITMGSKNNFLCPAVDYKGDNGYTLAPPSQHKSGKVYQWDRSPEEINIESLPELPDWVIGLLFNDIWYTRDDGLYIDAKKDYWDKHKKQQASVKKISKAILNNDLSSVPSDGFMCYHTSSKTMYNYNGISNGNTIYCNPQCHSSTSQASLHIDDKGDHYEWYCQSCNIGGKAYTPDEYRDYLEYQKFTASPTDENKGLEKWVNGDEFVDLLDPPSKKDNNSGSPKISNPDNFIKIPSNIDDGITLEEWGYMLKSVEYDEKYLPPFLNDYINDSSGYKKSIMPALLLGILAKYASLIGTTYYIRPNPYKLNWTEAPIIWGAAPGKSGSQKSGIKKIVDRPFTTTTNQMKKDDKKTKESYKKQLAIYSKKYKLWEADADANSSKMPLAPNIHNYPIQKTKVEDITLARLQTRMVSAHRGVIFYADELASVFNSFEALGGGAGGEYTKKTILKAYDSVDDIDVDRMYEDKEIPRWHISIFGFCVTKDFKASMLATQNKDDGWSARFLTALMPQGKVGNNYTPSADPDITILQRVAENMYEHKPVYMKEINGIDHEIMLFDSEAQSFFTKFDNDRALMMNKCPELRLSFYESSVSKLIGHAPRLAGIIHLIRYHSGLYNDLSPTVIDIKSCKMGCYWALYFHRHMYELLFESDNEGDSDLTDLEKKVKNSIVRNQSSKQEFKTLRDISKNLRITAVETKAACDGLKSKGLGEFVLDGKYFIIWQVKTF